VFVRVSVFVCFVRVFVRVCVCVCVCVCILEYMRLFFLDVLSTSQYMENS